MKPLDPQSILACPQCKGEVEAAEEEIRCPRCRLGFPRRGGIAIMLLEEARSLD